nr:CotH kinase family protein [Clostridia bacterium]
MKRVLTAKNNFVLFFACIFILLILCISDAAYAVENNKTTVDNGIPVVYLNIDESRGTIEDMIKSPDHSIYCYGTFSVDVPEGFHYSDFEDLDCESVEDLEMSIRGRGNSTWQRSAKKPFKIKLDKKTDLFGLGANKHWVLVANAFDESLMKDRITAWLGDKMGFAFTPRGVPVDVVMTGKVFGTQYLGSYYLSENVRVDDNRLEIAELDEDDTEPQIITGGYLLQNSLQVRDGSPDIFYTSRGVDWATHTPSFDTETVNADSMLKDGEEAFAGSELEDGYKNNAQQEYIQNYIQEFEDILFEEGTAYRDLMDVETAAKYWLVNVVSLNSDAFATGSTYIYKDRDTAKGVSKLYWGPLWDFDYAWNHNIITTGFDVGHEWMKPLFYDRSEGGFVQELHKQWPIMKAALEELVADGGIIDRYYEETKASAEQNHAALHPDTEFSYYDAVDALKTWIKNRMIWVDDNFSLLDNMVHKVTFLVDGEVYRTAFIEDGGYINSNEAYPKKDGYYFLGWSDEDGKIIDDRLEVKKDLTIMAKYVSDSEVTHGRDIAFSKDNDVVKYNVHIYTYTIPYTVIPADATDKSVEWSSSNEDYATVDDEGVVIYHGTGEVTLTAHLKYGGTRDFTLKVTEGEVPVPESIRPEKDVINMTVGEQSPCTVTTSPTPSGNVDCVYESEDTSVVTVGDHGVLTAVGPGRTKVHIKAVPYGSSEDDEGLPETFVTVIVSADFTDITPDAWYREAVDYAVTNGLMKGVGNNKFAPQGTATRAMITTILYRLEGEPAVSGANPFDDVTEGQWYCDAVIWANANGIITGYGNGELGPADE